MPLIRLTLLRHSALFLFHGWSGIHSGAVMRSKFSALVLILSSARTLIGGSLSRPADRFPGLFGHSTFMKAYPYFLACAGPASFTALAWLVTYMLLQEVG
jgi:hypothetical protein